MNPEPCLSDVFSEQYNSYPDLCGRVRSDSIGSIVLYGEIPKDITLYDDEFLHGSYESMFEVKVEPNDDTSDIENLNWLETETAAQQAHGSLFDLDQDGIIPSSPSSSSLSRSVASSMSSQYTCDNFDSPQQKISRHRGSSVNSETMYHGEEYCNYDDLTLVDGNTIDDTSPDPIPNLSLRNDLIYRSDDMIGAYTPDERKRRIARFHEKRKARIWSKRISYGCRKRLADDRPRVRGRFVKTV
jgi:hypothetical protein